LRNVLLPLHERCASPQERCASLHSSASPAGANGFVTKPIDVGLLVDEMARQLNMRLAY
jgi:hypothetical protein